MRSTPIQSLVVLTAAVALSCIGDVQSAPLQSPSSPQNKLSSVTIDQSLGSLRSSLDHLGSGSLSLESGAPSIPFGVQRLGSGLERRSGNPPAQNPSGKVTTDLFSNPEVVHPIARASVGPPGNPTFSADQEAIRDHPIPRVKISPSREPFSVQGPANRPATTDPSGTDQSPASTRPREPAPESQVNPAQKGANHQPHWSPEDVAFSKVMPKLREAMTNVKKGSASVGQRSANLQDVFKRQLASIDKNYPASGTVNPVELKARLIRVAQFYHPQLIDQQSERWKLEPAEVAELNAMVDRGHIPELKALAGFSKVPIA